MPNILQVPVPVTNASIVWPSRQSGVNSLLFINQDLNNTIWIGQESSITAAGPNTIPIPPNGTFSGDAASPWYVIGSVAGTQPLVVVPNGQAYFLGLTQGMGNLAIPSVQSPNFETGVQGWQIAKDGSAEFNNLVIRGTFYGTDFIINSLGLFFYSGDPTTGNLIASVAPASGSDDGHGNAFKDGFTVYDGDADIQVHVNSAIGAPAIEMPTAAGSEAEHSALYVDVANPGDANEEMNLLLIGPGSSYDNQQAGIGLTSSAKNGATVYAGEFLTLLSGVPTIIAYWNVSGITMQPGKVITADSWHTITLDSGWTAASGFDPPRYRLLPDGNLQLSGAASRSAFTANTNLNNSNPLPTAYRPVNTHHYKGVDNLSVSTVRAGVQIANTGVIEALTAGTSCTIIEIDAIIPLN